jgi:hypothetical protein
LDFVQILSVIVNSVELYGWLSPVGWHMQIQPLGFRA